MVVTVSELVRGFGHLSQGRSAVREQYATKAEVWGLISGNGSGRSRSRLSSGTGPVNWRLTWFRRPDCHRSQTALSGIQARRGSRPASSHPIVPRRCTIGIRRSGTRPPCRAWQRLRSPGNRPGPSGRRADDSGQLVNAVTLASLLPAGDCRHLPACGSARGPHARGPAQQRTGQLYIVKNRRTAPLMPFAAPGRAAGGAVGSNLMHPLHRQRRHQRPGAEQAVASWCASA